MHDSTVACAGALIQHCLATDIDADSWRNKEAEEKSKPKKQLLRLFPTT